MNENEASAADVLDKHLPLDLLNEVMEALLIGTDRDGLILADRFNRAVGASARKRLRAGRPLS